jgi:hypothetical protein
MCRPRHPKRPGLHPVAREHVENQKALQCQVELETPIWPAPEGGDGAGASPVASSLRAFPQARWPVCGHHVLAGCSLGVELPIPFSLMQVRRTSCA